MTNTLFVVFAADSPELLKKSIDAAKAVVALSVGSDTWLVMAPASMTTNELSDLLKITDGESGSAIIVRSQGYFGRANPDIWEWIRAKAGAELVVQTA